MLGEVFWYRFAIVHCADNCEHGCIAGLASPVGGGSRERGVIPKLLRGPVLLAEASPKSNPGGALAARMSLLHFRCKERRRTQRVALAVPLVINGQNEDGEKFSIRVKTNSVSQYGAQVETEHALVVGQILLLINENSARKVEARVASIQRRRDGKTHIGMEFLSGEINFWNMTFPLPGAKPMRRVFSKVSGNKVTA